MKGDDEESPQSVSNMHPTKCQWNIKFSRYADMAGLITFFLIIILNAFKD